MSFHVYIVTNCRDGTLYIGVTNDLVRRICELREKLESGSNERCNLTTLVFYEEYPTAEEAIACEKAMKKWDCAWEIRVIERMNPIRRDLYLDLNASRAFLYSRG